MSVLALLLWVAVLAQAQPQLAPPAPAPQPRAQASATALTAQDVVGIISHPSFVTAYAKLLYDGAGQAGVQMANGGFDVLNQVWSLPDFLMSSRTPEHTVDMPEAAQLNDDLTKQLGGLVLIGMLLVVGYQALSVLRGEVPNPAVAASALTVVALATVVAVNNRYFQHFPIDLVDTLLQTISGAPIRQFLQPGLTVGNTGDLVWNALFALALIVVALGLTVVLFIEGAWCIVLGALLGLVSFGSVLPIFGGGSQFLLRRWMGSLFSPVIVFTALRLAAPSTAMIAGLGTPTLALQLLMVAFLIVAWQAPGLMVGAIAVSFPGVSQAYFAGRLFGAGRFTERMIRRGDAGPGEGSSREDAPRSRRTPPTGPAGRRPGRTGMGTAASGRPWRAEGAS